MPVTDAPAKARALYDARRTRVPIPPFTDADPALGMADGYAIQRELVDLLLADGDRIIGHKVGLTSKPMQQMVGVDSPDYGPVLASTVYRDGDTIPISRFIAPKVEAEIVFVLGERLMGPGVTVTQAHAAIAAPSPRWRSSTRASPTGGSSSPTPSPTSPPTARSRRRAGSCPSPTSTPA
jgi:2-keto-4-pentenoate hydratase